MASFRIRAKNFLCFQELEIDFSNRGLVLIESENRDEVLLSSNGGGKTSLVEALNWGIFGVSTKSSDQDRLIHDYKHGGKNCEVFTWFLHYRIERYRSHSKYKNDLKLFDLSFPEDKQEITKKSMKDTQTEIERILGMSFQAFRHAIYFSQNNLAKFSNATDAEQKSILEEILSLNVLSEAQIWCKDKVKEFEQSIESKKQSLSIIANNLNDLFKRIEVLNQKSSIFESDKVNNVYQANLSLDKLREEAKTIRANKIELDESFDKDKAQSLIDQTEEKKTISEASKKSIAVFNTQINDINSKIKAKNNGIHLLNVSISNLNRNISQFDIDKSNLENKKTNVSDKITKLKDHLLHYSSPTVNCSECGQPVSIDSANDKRKSIEAQITATEKELEVLTKSANFEIKKIEMEESISLDTIEISNLQVEIKLLEDKIPTIKTQIREEEFKIESNTKLLEIANQLKLKIQEEESKKMQISMNLQKIELHDKLIEEKEKSIQEIEAQPNPYTLSIQEEESKTIALHLEKNEYNKQLSELLEEKKYYDYWADGFSNSRLKSYIMESITPSLNEKANHFAKFLTSGRYTIDISTQTKLKSGEMRDKFSVNVEAPSGSDYEMCSGGEKKRVDLCILLALQDLTAMRSNVPLDLLILDEFSESLDDVGAESMINLLKELSKTKESIFYITHNSEMKYLFPNSVKIVKENNVSRIIN